MLTNVLGPVYTYYQKYNIYTLMSVITGALTLEINESMHHLFWTGGGR